MKGDCNICTNGKLPPDSATCVDCGLSRKNYKPITNYDRLRAKSVEAMAVQIAEWNHGDCPPIELCPKHRNEATHYLECTPWKCWLDWLKQEVEE